MRPEEPRFWRDRIVTGRLRDAREWRKTDTKPNIGFSFEEKQQ